ncbi:MAG: hypothetical protein U5N53_13965 [Mycobacterium sp.]|nr:hypothetical protein [Mycobacterium sp.]
MSEFEVDSAGPLAVFAAVQNRIKATSSSTGVEIHGNQERVYWWLDGRSLGRLVCREPYNSDAGAESVVWLVLQLDKITSAKITLTTKGMPGYGMTWSRALVISHPDGEVTLSAAFQPDIETFIDNLLKALASTK